MRYSIAALVMWLIIEQPIDHRLTQLRQQPLDIFTTDGQISPPRFHISARAFFSTLIITTAVRIHLSKSSQFTLISKRGLGVRSSLTCIRTIDSPTTMQKVFISFQQPLPLLYQVLGRIVVSIPACHAGDWGSIPRRGVWSSFYNYYSTRFYFLFIILNQIWLINCTPYFVNVYIVFYYIITNEIPGELSHVIFTGEKITVAMGNIVNRALRSQKCLSEMFWYFIGVLYIRTLLGPSEIRNFRNNEKRNFPSPEGVKECLQFNFLVKLWMLKILTLFVKNVLCCAN